MAKDFSFDIVSDFNISEVHNAIDQTKREIATRYDFKGTSAGIQFDPQTGNGGTVTISGDNEFHIESILDILRKKLATRGVSQKVLNASGTIETSNMKSKLIVPLKKGLDQDKAKIITKLIRDTYPKVKTQIQGDVVRVSATSKDDLQGVMQKLNQSDFDFPLNFVNYR